MQERSSADPYSWVCKDAQERARFLDMHARLMPVNRWVTLVLVVTLAPGLALDGRALSLLPIAVALAVFAVTQLRAAPVRRPELISFGGVLVGEALIVTALVLNGRQHLADLALLTWPVIGFTGRYPARAVAAGTVYTAGLMIAASLGFGGAAVVADPLLLGMPLATLLSCTIVASAIRASDEQHRTAAAVDPLTSLLNRSSLTVRAAEVEHQSRATGEPVGVIVGDLDHFKHVNDVHGHAAGDAVLRDVAETMRRSLRAFDLAYRLGGEEFVVLALGAGAKQTAALAERLRQAIGGTAQGGIDVTMSFGVAASSRGTPFVWRDVFERADTALYAAKRAGRDRVAVDAGEPRSALVERPAPAGAPAHVPRLTD
jgi:diguanylate cyclase (GGDEF)-like protein